MTVESAAPLSRQHIGALDGVRGVAVLLVIMYHMGSSMVYEFKFDNLLVYYGARFSWVGVDLFFVLSGFLITGILYDSKGTEKYFTKFYARRSLRIFPLYYLALISFLVLRHLWPELGQYGSSNPIYLWFYLTNFVMANGGNFGILDHFWSLAIEEQFYFLWPAFVYRFSRERLMMIATVVWCGALLLRTVGVLLWRNLEAISFLTFCRVDTLMTGAFLALLVRGALPMQAFRLPALAVAVIAALGIVTIVLVRLATKQHDPLMITVGFSFIAILFGAILMMSLTWRPAALFFNLRFLRECGKYSYGLYVWHAPIFMIAFHSKWVRQLRGDSGLTEAMVSMIVAVAVTVAFTMASWHLWEKQFLKLKRRFD